MLVFTCGVLAERSPGCIDHQIHPSIGGHPRTIDSHLEQLILQDQLAGQPRCAWCAYPELSAQRRDHSRRGASHCHAAASALSGQEWSTLSAAAEERPRSTSLDHFLTA